MLLLRKKKTIQEHPDNINKRHAKISASKEIFDKAIYDYKLTYNISAKQTTRNKRNWKRNITRYNSPWNSNVKTNLGNKCLSIVDKYFPKNHPLNKIFNRCTLKLSYSCMPNMKTIIASHITPNKKPHSSNCRQKVECPLEGKCLQENVVYQATVTM